MVMETASATQGLYPRFSDAEYARRHQAVREAMEREGLEALLVVGPGAGQEVHYLINMMLQLSTWLVFPREGEPTCFMHFHNSLPCAREQAIIEDVRWYGPSATETLEHPPGRGLPSCGPRPLDADRAR